MARPCKILVVGAGLAGLSVAHSLARLDGTGRGIVVLERDPVRVGGRIRTHASRGYELGAGRIYSNHRLTRRLLDELGIGLVDLRAASVETPAYARVRRAGAAVKAPPRVRGGGLSLRDRRILASAGGRLEPVVAASLDSTYEGGDLGDRELQDQYETFPDLASATFYKVVGGYDSVPRALAARLEAMGGEVLLGQNVVDVAPRRVRARDAASGLVTTYEAPVVIIATPPRAVERWPAVYPYVAPICRALQERPLCRIYARLRGAEKVRRWPFYVKTTSVLCKVISEAERPWVQVSYSSGRDAEFWMRLRECSPATFADLLDSLVRQDLVQAGLVRAADAAAVGVDRASLDSCFWPVAAHAFRPARRRASSPMSWREMTTCHATALPGVFWANEAVSPVHAWAEGALLSAQEVVRRVGVFRRGGLPTSLPVLPAPPAGARAVLGRVYGAGDDGGFWDQESWYRDKESQPCMRDEEL